LSKLEHNLSERNLSKFEHRLFLGLAAKEEFHFWQSLEIPADKKYSMAMDFNRKCGIPVIGLEN
jgi:hypothetical protein